MFKMIISSALNIKSLYIASKVTIFDARKFILFSFLVFILSIIIGYSFFSDSQIVRDNYVELYREHQGHNYFIYVSKILFNNVTVAYISMRLGILLGLFPAISEMATGITIGWLFANAKNIHWLKLLFVLAPHGLFELTAMLIAWGIGFWRCKMLFVPNYDKVSKENVKQIHKVFITVVLPLLVLAAFIEGGPLLF